MAGALPMLTSPHEQAANGAKRPVLFADMAGFTAISERLGEEDTCTLGACSVRWSRPDIDIN